MLKDLGIKYKLYLGFGSILAIMLVLLVSSYLNFEKLAEARKWDRHTREVMFEGEQMSTALLQIQTSTRGFMLTGEEKLVGPIAQEEENARRHLANVMRMTADNSVQQARLQKLAPMLDNWIVNVIHPLIEKRRELNKKVGVSQQVASYGDVVNGAKIIADIRAILKEFESEELKLLSQRTSEADKLAEDMRSLLSIGALVCVALGAVIATIIANSILPQLGSLTAAAQQIAAGNAGARAEVMSKDELGQAAAGFNDMAQKVQESTEQERARNAELRTKVDALLAVVSRAASGDLTGRIDVQGDDAVGRIGDGLRTMFDNLRRLLSNVQRAGIQVTTSSTEIAASAKQQEATGIEQAQTSVEILATTKEISANTSQLLKAMEEATGVADYTANATSDAQVNLKRMDGTMQRMVAATDLINAKLAALSEKASNINSVLTTITKVADQTNILSLNAAIEAEKAGEAGRGFSVVATEIRRLADQTSVSTWDIEQMLKEMQSAVSASVMGMDKFSEEIRRSVGEVSQVAEQLSSVMDQVQKLTPQFDMVLQGMQSQAVGAQQITETMMQLNDATQQTVDSLKATSEAVQQLQYAAGDLQSSVATFSVNS
jgi:methyl-accepting chemotaxis protein WspA